MILENYGKLHLIYDLWIFMIQPTFEIPISWEPFCLKMVRLTLQFTAITLLYIPSGKLT